MPQEMFEWNYVGVHLVVLVFEVLIHILNEGHIITGHARVIRKMLIEIGPGVWGVHWLFQLW
jgi:hypothetical protein